MRQDGKAGEFPRRCTDRARESNTLGEPLDNDGLMSVFFLDGL
jgi:hypothetical protein